MIFPGRREGVLAISLGRREGVLAISLGRRAEARAISLGRLAGARAIRLGLAAGAWVIRPDLRTGSRGGHLTTTMGLLVQTAFTLGGGIRSSYPRSLSTSRSRKFIPSCQRELTSKSFGRTRRNPVAKAKLQWSFGMRRLHHA